MTNRPDDRVIHHHHYDSCCWPTSASRGGIMFWSATLLVLGGVWLTAHLIGVDNWGEWLVPTLFVAWGAMQFINDATAHSARRHSASDDR